jgi:hypothetical protein
VLWLFALTTALWGFVAGLLVSLGVAAGIIGVQSVIGLLIITQYSMPLDDGLGRAGLVLLGGLVQVVLLLTAWPLRRSPVERSALAQVYRSLAEYAAALPAGVADPPDVRPLADARRALRDPQPFLRDAHALLFQQLHDEAERARTTLAGLALVRGRLVGWPARERAVALLDQLAAQAAVLLRDIAAAAELPRSAARAAALTAAGPERDPERWERLGRPAAGLRAEAAAAGPSGSHVGASLVGELERLATALLGQLEAVVRLSRATAGPLPSPRRSTALRDALPTLRAHLTLRSAVLRHALRLAGVLGVATALAGRLPFEHRYWLPLTALVVLKPDFRSTFTRGLGPHPRHGRRGAAGRSGHGGPAARAGAAHRAVVVDRLGLLRAPVRQLRAVRAVRHGVRGVPALLHRACRRGRPSATASRRRCSAACSPGGVRRVADVGAGAGARAAGPAARGAVRLRRDAARAVRRPVRLDVGRLEELRTSARLARSNAEASVTRARPSPSAPRRTDAAPGGSGPGAGPGVRPGRARPARPPAEARAIAVEPQLLAFAVQLRSSLDELAAALRDGRPPDPLPELCGRRPTSRQRSTSGCAPIRRPRWTPPCSTSRRCRWPRPPPPSPTRWPARGAPVVALRD